MDIHPLYLYLLNSGGEKPEDETWLNIAKKFNVSPDEPDPKIRAKRAKDRWDKFKGRTKGSLLLKQVKTGKNGEITSETYTRPPTPLPRAKRERGLPIKKISKSNIGVEWEIYEKSGNRISEDDIIEVFKNLSSAPIKRLKKWKSARKRTALVDINALGDIHIGMEAKDNIFGLSWDSKQAFERAELFLSHINLKADEIYVIFGGDIADGLNGTTTRGGHTLPQNMDGKEQLKTAGDLAIFILDNVSRHTKAKIQVKFLTNSNHGGILDFATGWMLKKIAPHRWGGQVTIDLQREFIKGYSIKGRTILATHGKDEKHMQRGLPRFLSKDNMAFIERIIEHQDAESTILLRFDQHQYHDILYNKFRDIMCPAFSNPSSFLSMNYSASYKGGFTKIEIDDHGANIRLIEF